jgi:hypothetical protein
MAYAFCSKTWQVFAERQRPRMRARARPLTAAARLAREAEALSLLDDEHLEPLRIVVPLIVSLDPVILQALASFEAQPPHE